MTDKELILALERAWKEYCNGHRTVWRADDPNQPLFDLLHDNYDQIIGLMKDGLEVEQAREDTNFARWHRGGRFNHPG